MVRYLFVLSPLGAAIFSVDSVIFFVGFSRAHSCLFVGKDRSDVEGIYFDVFR